ncbi:unnamed protein product [Rotaria sp. Silwood2]|nr:unnamed protein product [Rotaria sp. Silwood2]CAF2935513.1 unnamed protein product [Rotaria sp. Silwood2]CAF3318948.1 unnamed protein product [Rotaria sp. Silwood2]CAF4070000.1 unnamed protein product [Rotaria sp. Silwood2]CAF4070872.1 unnamed protein product [Rotaria sp. Silwood2]
MIYLPTSLQSSSLRIQPLVYDPALSRFPSKTSISMIIKELMVDQWNPSSSHEYFYEACAPIYCSYSQRIRKENFIRVVIMLVSMIGGIVASLRILTPHFVKFVLKFLTMFKKTSEQGN